MIHQIRTNYTCEKKHRCYCISLSVISLLCCFVGCELLARALVPKEFFQPMSNIYRPVNAEYRYTLKPNLNTTAFGVPLKTNSFGFRGREWTLSKDKNRVRIALLGDSHAFGYGVAFDETVGEKLAAKLNERGEKEFEVLNFGVVGYNSRQELAVLQSDVLKFNPDILIVIPCNNDHKDSFNASADGFLVTQNNVTINDESIEKLKIKTSSWFIGKSRLLYYLLFLKKQFELSHGIVELREPTDRDVADRSRWWMGPFEPVPIPEQLYKTVYEPLQEMIRVAKMNNMPIVIANFNALPAYRQLFAQLAQEEDVPSLELLSLFPEVNSWQELLQKFGLGWNNHLNANAHDRWAESLCKIVINMKK